MNRDKDKCNSRGTKPCKVRNPVMRRIPGGKRLEEAGRLLLGETDRKVKSCPSGTVTLGRESTIWKLIGGVI